MEMENMSVEFGDKTDKKKSRTFLRKMSGASGGSELQPVHYSARSFAIFWTSFSLLIG